MILFCIPGASASAMMFIKWRKMFDGNVEVCPVELPGRGLRFRDALISDMKLLARDLYRQIEKRLQTPYAILGYCLGSIAAYELYGEINRNGAPPPKHFFLVSGATPDSQGDGATLFYNEKSKKYLTEIIHYLVGTQTHSGTEQTELFSESVSDYAFEKRGVVSESDVFVYAKMLHQYALPVRNPDGFAREITNIVRIFNADSVMLHCYKPEKPFRKIKVPTTMIWAEDDHLLSRLEPEKWRAFIDAPFEIVQVSGEHLFLFFEPSPSIKIIKRRIEQIHV